MRDQPDWRHGGFGVYVHWPFCLSKCPYCDFNSHVAKAPVDHPRYAAALIAELHACRALTGPRRADTLFFGGGTPSLMAAETVAAVIEAVARLWGFGPDPEITLEANPTSIEAGRFAAYAEAGVNRVSMGAQALNDSDLAALGRTHSVAEARAGFAIARRVFPRVSFDLIYARPGQSRAAWRAELAEALALAADHLSLYQLTIEPGTRFYELHARGRLRVPPPPLAADLYADTQDLCEKAGMPAYEVSNHALPGQESRHNLVYWRYGDYAGVGPGAHGRITGEDGARRASEAPRDPARWLAAVEARGSSLDFTPLSGADQALEMLLMGMRLSEGVEEARWARLNGSPLDPAARDALEAEGMLRRDAGRIAATPRGRLLLDPLLVRLAV